MNQRYIWLGVMWFALMLGLGCSVNDHPVILPDSGGQQTTVPQTLDNFTHLWGIWDVEIDPDTLEVTVVPNRSLEFTCNVTSIINSKPPSLKFKINGTPIGPDYIDVDIDVTLTHPFQGLPQYNGYDVRGVFMGDGLAKMKYNGDLYYPQPGVDQHMLPDPVDGFGGPDGYTRWYNPDEFPIKGLFGYTLGAVASPGYIASATLCPYKYFADGLGTEEDLWTFLVDNTDSEGVFSSGTSNTRNYYIRFPNAKGVRYNYAVVANWESETAHPSNATEAVGSEAEVTDYIYYVDPTNNGGNLIVDFSIFDWGSSVLSGVMQDYIVKIESTVLSGVYECTTADMTPTGGGERYSTYHVDIPANNVLGTSDNAFWLIVEYPDHDYSNPYDIPNDASSDALAAFFKYDIDVATEPINLAPFCDLICVTPMPYDGPATQIEFDASGSWDYEGDPLTFEWDFNDDGVFGDPYENGTDDHPFKFYNYDWVGDVSVQVTDTHAQSSVCSVTIDLTIDITKNIPLREGVAANDIAVDHSSGDLLILYADGEVWVSEDADEYQTSTYFFSTQEGCERIDISPNGYIITGGNAAGTTQYSASYNPSGTLVGAHVVPSTGLREVIGVTSPTSMNNYHATVTGYFVGNYVYMSRYAPTAYLSGSSNIAICGSGPGSLNLADIVGCESVDDSYYVYFLEDGPEYSVERWNIYLGYTGVEWHGKASGMGGFNEPKDITRDNNNDIYVLDRMNNGAPKVKKYDMNGGAIGSFSDSVNVSGYPQRIEGSDYNGNIFVLHDEGISVFTPGEMP